jgi:hypothetical protein
MVEAATPSESANTVDLIAKANRILWSGQVGTEFLGAV